MMSLTAQVSFDSYVPKVAIVTGSAQGIGFAIAHRLADDGLDVAVNDVPAKQKELDSIVEEIRKKGRRAIAVAGDISSESDVASIVETTVCDLGGVDIMIANAGIFLAGGFLELPVEKLDAAHAVNVRGTFLCLKYAALQMVKQGRGGRLIAASSASGKQGGQNITAYAASKFAIRGITQSASVDLRQYGITVNTYAPGAIRTPMSMGALEAMPSIQKIMDSNTSAEPEVIASLVSYLAKPESYFLNGQSITIDGGYFRFD